MTQSKYDVAISFLSADEPTAAALYSSLSEGLTVFFYPRSQEELAGKDGLEAMRTPFLNDSRLVVVLFREPWGETAWTRVEQTAITDGCLQYGWQRLFFMLLDKTSILPKWLPATHVRFNYADFGLEQAIGAIKARAQEAGSVIAPLTVLKRAELTQQETHYLQEKERLRSPLGQEIVAKGTLELFTKIKELSAQITASGTTSIECASEAHQCHLRNRVSLLVTFSPYSEPKLVVREFSNRLRMGSEAYLFYPDGEPRKLSEIKFFPDMNRAREYGWSEAGKPSKFLSSTALAERIVIRFIDLAAKDERGRFAKGLD